MKLTEQTITHIIIGSGAAGFQAALRLYQNGERDLAIITENIKSGKYSIWMRRDDKSWKNSSVSAVIW